MKYFLILALLVATPSMAAKEVVCETTLNVSQGAFLHSQSLPQLSQLNIGFPLDAEFKATLIDDSVVRIDMKMLFLDSPFGQGAILVDPLLSTRLEFPVLVDRTNPGSVFIHSDTTRPFKIHNSLFNAGKFATFTPSVADGQPSPARRDIVVQKLSALSWKNFPGSLPILEGFFDENGSSSLQFNLFLLAAGTGANRVHDLTFDSQFSCTNP